MTYIPLRPTPLRERASILFLEHGQIDVADQAFVLIDDEGRTHIPVAGLACLMLEPGTRISHAAIKLAALEAEGSIFVLL
jgi:CRISP-associated protein Cas1